MTQTLVSSGTFRGPPRRPPPHILDQVKSLNQSLRLGHLLCRSRNPDFLLNIIQRQASPQRLGQRGAGGVRTWDTGLPREGPTGGRQVGREGPWQVEPERAVRRRPVQASSQSMPWLADLVQSSEGSLDVLPVQCLCEFLLHDAADEPASAEEEEEGESKEQKAKKRQVGASPRPPPHPTPAGPAAGLRSSVPAEGRSMPPSPRPSPEARLRSPVPAEAAEAAAAAGPPAGPAAGPQGRRADHV